MTAYDIDTVAQLCGVTPATLRAWQRYGLLHPQRTEQGHRRYQETDLSQIHEIRRWVEQGVPVNKIKPLIDGDLARVAQGWESQGDALFALLEKNQSARLRQLVWRYGREYPGDNFINAIVRPLRLWLKLSSQPAAMQQRSLLDSALLEYATFMLNSTRKKPGAPVMLIAWQSSDSVDLWLEAIALCAETLRLEVLPTPVPDPDFGYLKADHFLLWTDKRLTGDQQQRYEQWLEQGVPVMLVGPGALKRKALHIVSHESLPRVDLDDIEELE